MTGKGKIRLYIAAAIAFVCLAGWIALLYVQKAQEEKGWEHEFLTRYHAALNDMASDLGRFEEAETFEGQLSCLEAIASDLVQLKAHMEMHINLAGISMPEKTASGVDMAGWREAESVIGLVSKGGTVDSCQIASFQADGAISEEEAAVIQFLKAETDRLYGDMTVPDENGMNYRYVLPSIEVYQRLTAIFQDMKAQLIRINRK